MTNVEFIKEYGKHNFYDLKDYVEQLLFQYKYEKVIKGYRIHGRKGYVTIYNNGGSINLQLATVWKMKREEFKDLQYKEA